MSRRSDAQLDEMLDALLALARKPGKGKDSPLAVELLVQRFRRAYERDKAGSAIPDGYPRGTSFDGCGGMRFDVPADRWEGESRIELTSVELAIEHRVFSQKTIKDHHRDLTRGAAEDLERAVRALDELSSKLARIENLVDTNPNATNAIPGCRSHARLPNHHGQPTWASAARDAGGRNGLCRDCYNWTLAHDNELPPVEIVELVDRKGAGNLTTKDVTEAMKAAKRRAS